MGCCVSTQNPSSGAKIPQRSGASVVDKLREASVAGTYTCSHDDPLLKYDILDTLGTGGFAVVKRVRDKSTGDSFAMKIISVKNDDEEDGDAEDDEDEEEKEMMTLKEVMSEVETLRKLRHPAILSLREYFVLDRAVYVVTELLSGGAVLDAILKMKDERYTEQEAKVVVKCTLEGIDFMHRNAVVHRDLKLENLLLKTDDDLSAVVIADFGLAKRCREKAIDKKYHSKGVDDSAVGTPVYAAPEVVEQKSYGFAVDMWSLGVITYILVTGAMPRDLWKSALKYHRVNEKDFGFECYEWDTVSMKAKEFVMACLTYNPAKRISAKDALKHPWMSQVTNVRPAPLRIKSKLRDFAKGMKLPVRRYEPGELLLKQGARSTDEVFLIKSGKVDIMVHPPKLPDGTQPPPFKVATRETGEFVGEMSVGSKLLQNVTEVNEKDKKENEKLAKKMGSGKSDKSEKDVKLTHIGSVNAAIASKIAAKKWVGQRRTADVVAVTRVECLVLGKREMQWAIKHDEEVAEELRKDIRKRKQQTEGQLEKAKSVHEKKAASGKQEGSGKSREGGSRTSSKKSDKSDRASIDDVDVQL